MALKILCIKIVSKILLHYAVTFLLIYLPQMGLILDSPPLVNADSFVCAPLYAM